MRILLGGPVQLYGGIERLVSMFSEMDEQIDGTNLSAWIFHLVEMYRTKVWICLEATNGME